MTVENRILINQLLEDLSAEDLYEAGGIIGGKNGVVTVYAVDRSQKSQHPCTYIPDVSMLNQTIRQWYEEDLVLMGIFHTHHFGVRTLSEGDKSYIQKVMSVAPPEVRKMYFPVVVMPGKEVVAYIAERINNGIRITKDTVVFKED